MTSLRFNHRWAIAVTAVAAFTLTLSHYPTSSTRPLARAVVADLTAEKQALTSFETELSNLEKKVIELQKRSSITSSELNATKTSASTLKTKTSQLQQTVQSVIRKLKAAGEWDNFDATVLAQVTEPKTQTLLRNAGGAKKILENAATQLSGLSQDIDAMVQPLNSRVASTGSSFGNKAMLGFVPVRASIIPTRTAAFFGLGKCLFRLTVYVVKGGFHNEQRADCACMTDPTPEQRFNCTEIGQPF